MRSKSSPMRLPPDANGIGRYCCFSSPSFPWAGRTGTVRLSQRTGRCVSVAPLAAGWRWKRLPLHWEWVLLRRYCWSQRVLDDRNRIRRSAYRMCARCTVGRLVGASGSRWRPGDRASDRARALPFGNHRLIPGGGGRRLHPAGLSFPWMRSGRRRPARRRATGPETQSPRPVRAAAASPAHRADRAASGWRAPGSRRRRPAA